MQLSATSVRGWIAVFGMLVLAAAGAARPAEGQAGQSDCKELSPTLAQATPRSLTAMVVIGRDDETVGRVESVARHTRTDALQLILLTNGGERLALGLECIEAIDAQLRLTYSLSDGALRERIARFDPGEFAPVAADADLVRLAEPSRAG